MMHDEMHYNKKLMAFRRALVLKAKHTIENKITIIWELEQKRTQSACSKESVPAAGGPREARRTTMGKIGVWLDDPAASCEL